jgi:hypothetical protein
MGKPKQKRIRYKVEDLKRYIDQQDVKLDNLTFELKRLKVEYETLLQQSGGMRVALKNVHDGFSKGLKAINQGVNDALCGLEISLGFTNKEITTMSAADYKEKILKPLGMVEHIYGGSSGFNSSRNI